jgi:hypothetical protein
MKSHRSRRWSVRKAISNCRTGGRSPVNRTIINGHGTTTLFAALDVATGKVIGRHTKRRRRVEFLAFMNGVIAHHPDREIHVILNNLSTHKPKRDLWLARHKTMHAREWGLPYPFSLSMAGSTPA